MQPFPTAPDKRREAAAAMKSAAPELMDEIARLRAAFPGSRMTHFKAPGIEYGRTAKSGWVVDVPVPKTDIEIAEQKRLQASDKKRHDAIKKRLPK